VLQEGDSQYKAKDLRKKYKRVEYLDHKLEEGYLDTSVDGEFVFSVVFEVG